MSLLDTVEPDAWMHDQRKDTVPNAAKQLWLKVRAKQVEHYTKPLYSRETVESLLAEQRREMMSDNINQTMRNIDADQNVLDELDCLRAEVASLKEERDAWKARSERRVADLREAVERYEKQLASLKEQNALLAAQGLRVYAAADAVVKRWDTPLWKDVPHTAEFIYALRDALTALPRQVKSEDARDALAVIARGDARSIATGDQCSQGKYGYEDCELCICDFAEAAISAQEEIGRGL